MDITLHFATTNQRKLTEARDACSPAGIVVEQLILDIAEIQSSDPLEVARHKAESAFSMTNKPVVVGDTSWKIPALNGFPGAYMKDVADWFTPQDWLDLMSRKADRSICFIETIVYHDSSQIKVFSNEYWGEVASQPSGQHGVSIEKVAAFNGQTISHRRDQGKTAYDAQDYIWTDVVKWLTTEKP